jgi:hypothetical protein
MLRGLRLLYAHAAAGRSSTLAFYKTTRPDGPSVLTETGIRPSHHLSGERRDAVPIFSFDAAQSFGAKREPPAQGPGTDEAILDNATTHSLSFLNTIRPIAPWDLER